MATAYTGDIVVTFNEVFAATGNTYDPVTFDVKIAHALSTIEIVSGVLALGADRDVYITTADAAWLKKAIIYQTVWEIDNPDTYSRTGVTSLTQDGVHVSAPNELTFVLAPLAKRALGNCSWSKSGTLKVAVAEPRTSENFLVSDDHAWTPLAGV